jgi:hypothetical protein
VIGLASWQAVWQQPGVLIGIEILFIQRLKEVVFGWNGLRKHVLLTSAIALFYLSQCKLMNIYVIICDRPLKRTTLSVGGAVDLELPGLHLGHPVLHGVL